MVAAPLGGVQTSKVGEGVSGSLGGTGHSKLSRDKREGAMRCELVQRKGVGLCKT